MSRTQQPARPADDLAVPAGRRDRIAEGSALSRELAAFMQSGISVILGAVGANRQPIAGVALACRIEADGRVRVLLRRPANLALLEALGAGGAVAVTFSRPRDHRSIQVKASRARIVPCRAEDLPELARQCAGMRDELVGAAYPPAFAAAYAAYEPGEVAAIELAADRAFVQTPGPGAGGEIVP